MICETLDNYVKEVIPDNKDSKELLVKAFEDYISHLSLENSTVEDFDVLLKISRHESKGLEDLYKRESMVTNSDYTKEELEKVWDYNEAYDKMILIMKDFKEIKAMKEMAK